MIEKFVQSVIQELGATGLLLLGICVVGFHVAKEISRPLKTINEEIGQIRDILKEILSSQKK